jgi:serine/threonine protein kinase
LLRQEEEEEEEEEEERATMNRYKVTKQLGDGTYGSVLKAQNRQTGEIVSILSFDFNEKLFI